MRSVLKYVFRFSFLIMIQVFVLDKIRIHNMVTPYLYFLFILWLPFNIKTPLLLLLSFFLGFTVDAFRHHPGFHAAACVLMAYIRPYVISLLIPQEGAESNYEEPSFQSMGGKLPYLIYAGFLIFLHNIWLFTLQAWQFGDLLYFFGKTLISTLISILIVLTTELIFNRNQKFRTNTI